MKTEKLTELYLQRRQRIEEIETTIQNLRTEIYNKLVMCLPVEGDDIYSPGPIPINSAAGHHDRRRPQCSPGS